MPPWTERGGFRDRRSHDRVTCGGPRARPLPLPRYADRASAFGGRPSAIGMPSCRSRLTHRRSRSLRSLCGAERLHETRNRTASTPEPAENGAVPKYSLTAARPVGVSLCHQDQATLRPLSSPECTHPERRGPPFIATCGSSTRASSSLPESRVGESRRIGLLPHAQQRDRCVNAVHVLGSRTANKNKWSKIPVCHIHPAWRYCRFVSP